MVAAVAVGMAGLLAGCAGAVPTDPADPAVPAGLPEGVAVSLVQLRGDVAGRQAQVQIVNGGDAPLTVGAVSVADPRFVGEAVRVVDRRSVVPAGGTVNVRVQLPAMDCGATASGTATATLELGVGAAAPARVTADLPDTLGFVPALHRRECLAAALAAVADVSIAAFTPDDPAGASLTLAVSPTGRGAATLVAVHATPLLMYAADAPAGSLALDVELDAPAEVRIPLVPQRCDPHVVQEDKRGTVFTFDVVVDGVAGEVDIPAAPEMKARMLTWVAEQCGFA